MYQAMCKKSPNNAINSDVKKLRRSFLALQLFASGYGWRWPKAMKKSLHSKDRANIIARDGHQCVKCNRGENLEVHHIIARVHGGSDDYDNLTTLCIACHEEWHAAQTVANVTFAEWLSIPSLVAFITWYKIMRALLEVDQIGRLSSCDVLRMLDDGFDLSKQKHREWSNEPAEGGQQ